MTENLAAALSWGGARQKGWSMSVLVRKRKLSELKFYDNAHRTVRNMDILYGRLK